MSRDAVLALPLLQGEGRGGGPLRFGKSATPVARDPLPDPPLFKGRENEPGDWKRNCAK
jgi:hypothetical protein